MRVPCVLRKLNRLVERMLMPARCARLHAIARVTAIHGERARMNESPGCFGFSDAGRLLRPDTAGPVLDGTWRL